MGRSRFRTQFCFIGPGVTLDRYASYSRTHLVLPQVTNGPYQEFYRRKRREGDLIILDNGAYEGIQDFTLLRTALGTYTPQVAALPDYLLESGEKTFEAAREFIKGAREEWPGVKWMYIPQSTPGDVQGWYRWLWVGVKELKPDWIGIPRALATDISTGPNAWLERANAVEQLTMRGINTHALGMVKGNLKELEMLFWEGCCSVDNSSAIWRGLNGFSLSQTHGWDVHGTPVNFDWEGDIGDSIDNLIKNNINTILRVVGQKEVR